MLLGFASAKEGWSHVLDLPVALKDRTKMWCSRRNECFATPTPGGTMGRVRGPPKFGIRPRQMCARLSVPVATESIRDEADQGEEGWQAN